MSKRLLYLNGIAILLAVLHHTTDWVLTAMYWWTDRYRDVSVPNYDLAGSLTYYIVRIIDQFGSVGVTFFLVVSGYFLAGTVGHTIWRAGLRQGINRSLHLIPAYLAWSAIILVMRYVFGERFEVFDVVRMMITGGASGPFYYVPLLIQLLILSPWLIMAVKWNWRVSLLAAVLLQVPVIICNEMSIAGFIVPDWINLLFRDWYLPGYLLWFMLGIAIGLNVKQFKEFTQQYRYWLLVGLVITFVLNIAESEWLRQLAGVNWISIQVTATYRFYALIFLIVLLSFDWAPVWAQKTISQIGSKSYGIYLMHIPVMTITAKLVYHLAPGLLGITLLFQLILVVVSAGMPYYILRIVERSPIKRVYPIAFG